MLYFNFLQIFYGCIFYNLLSICEKLKYNKVVVDTTRKWILLIFSFIGKQIYFRLTPCYCRKWN